MNYENKNQMLQFFFHDPHDQPYKATIDEVKVEYFYFDKPFEISTVKNEVCNFCLLKGTSNCARKGDMYSINQFDLVFLPEKDKITISPSLLDKSENKICVVKSPILGDLGKELAADFEIQSFSFEKFAPRGELGDTQKISTYREVWTAFKNGLFMSGFTNIPQISLEQGVITSVNLEREGNKTKIFSHIHPGYPEIYIFCIDDPTSTIAVTQYLINAQGHSVSKDLTNGEGIFFDGSLGHLNFTKPTYAKMNFCQYMWIIPTFGKTKEVNPTTLWI